MDHQLWLKKERSCDINREEEGKRKKKKDGNGKEMEKNEKQAKVIECINKN